MGTGTIGLASLLQRGGLAELGGRSINPLSPQPQHFPAKAKNLIMLFMTGGPSQIDTFDPKPELVKYDNQTLPESYNSEGLSLQLLTDSLQSLESLDSLE